MRTLLPLFVVLLTACAGREPMSSSSGAILVEARTVNAPSAWAPGTVHRFAARWTEPGTGWVYDGVLTLRLEGRNVVGEIAWTLVAYDPREIDLAHRVGVSAIEYVAGVYAPAEGRIDLEGQSVSDPGLISTDRYRLVLGVDGSLVGRTETNDRDWEGSLIGRAL
jgi:hypothetical protein